MTADPRRIIVTESFCDGCGVHSIQVYHERFPELRIEAASAERAADNLADRLSASLDSASDPSHHQAVRVAIDDVRAFLGPEGAEHPARRIAGSASR